MPWTRPSLAELVERISADISGRLLDGEDLGGRTVLGVLARVQAGAAHLQHGFLDWVGRQIFVDTAESEYLERHAAIWAVTRKPASRAQGPVVFTGADGSVVPAGTELQTTGGALCTTDADAVVSGGQAQAVATAKTAGTDGNLSAGTSLALTSPVAGVQSQAVVGAAGFAGGADAETDEDLRGRLLTRIQEPPQGGSASDYVAWALQVPGVTRAWVYPGRMGVGTVGLTFVMDNAEDIIPDAESVAAVQAHLEEVRPVTAEVFVFAPTAVPVDFDIRLTPDTTAVRASVELELADLLVRAAEPEGAILLSQINEAVSTAPGETDHVVLSPTSNVVMGAGQIAVLGTITWEDA